MSNNKLPIALSNRHLHLEKEHIDILFGLNYELTKMKNLSQPGQYAAMEKVDLEGKKGVIKGVRVLGPARNKTQVEISKTDSFILGIDAPVRDSGDLDGSAGLKIIGPEGTIILEEGIILAARHIHMHIDDAKQFGVQDKQVVKARTTGERAIIFENVLVRVHENYALEMHVDVDEGNAALLKNYELVELIK
ncbi:MAG: phosphate propanoyltransferase [Alkaliphilus sp.]